MPAYDATAVGLCEMSGPEGVDVYGYTGITPTEIEGVPVPPSPLYLQVKPTGKREPGAQKMSCNPEKVKYSAVYLPQSWVTGLGRINIAKVLSLPMALGRSSGPTWIGKSTEGPIEGADLDKMRLEFDALTEPEKVVILNAFFPHQSYALLVGDTGEQVVAIGTHRVESQPEFSIKLLSDNPLPQGDSLKLVFLTEKMVTPAADGTLSVDASKATSYNSGSLQTVSTGLVFRSEAAHGDLFPVAYDRNHLQRMDCPRARDIGYTESDFKAYCEGVLPAIIPDRAMREELRPGLRFTAAHILDFIGDPANLRAFFSDLSSKGMDEEAALRAFNAAVNQGPKPDPTSIINEKAASPQDKARLIAIAHLYEALNQDRS